MTEHMETVSHKERKVFRNVLIGLLAAGLLLLAVGYLWGARYFGQHYLDQWY